MNEVPRPPENSENPQITDSHPKKVIVLFNVFFFAETL
jgi:hypothetical protein